MRGVAGVAKRGRDFLLTPLDEALVAAQERGVEVLALNEALDDLARFDPRKSRVIELRFFGGLSIEETSEVLVVSVETVKRDFRMARAWLLARLSGGNRTQSSGDGESAGMNRPTAGP
ncbi:MAG: ECF-type sigma factor [Bryobacterales bacterium]|nr:ECF-type sigma factor [Bryobacterales bacterium]